ncbi:MAG: glutathione S-transferase family protein [Desulfobacterales bacterium]|nr:glutathione S-transferase family protein [Desulfobacterales bacterium]
MKPISKDGADWIIFGSELSPFTLKLIAMCEYAGLPHRFLPDQGKTLENFKIIRRKESLVRNKLPLTWPEMTELDEFPAVPFLFGPDGENLYDSSAIGVWLDRQAPIENRRHPLFPDHDPALAFIIRLIDEYADEYGLYMVHHYRWKVSAKDNDAGKRLAHEFRTLVRILQPLMARRLGARQTRRLPYLFSVAPRDFKIEGLPKDLQPPTRGDSPPTHQLLEESFTYLLSVLEPVLKQRSYLLGDRFTLADAGIYGQLAMNLTDPSAAETIRDQAPTTYRWLQQILAGDFTPVRSNGHLGLDDAIAPLLAEICRVYVPLMQQNLAAYHRYRKQDQTLFNEEAFWKDQALYDGVLDGHPFRSVVKTFQAKTWLDVRQHWDSLESDSRQRLESILPEYHGLDRDTPNA